MARLNCCAKIWVVVHVICLICCDSTVAISVSEVTAIDAPAVSTPDDSNARAIEGFGTTLRCYVNACVRPAKSIKWYKFSDVIAENLTPTNRRYEIQYSQDLTDTECNAACESRRQTCPTGHSCRLTDSVCCKCAREEFSLFIKNLTFADSGTYRCQLEGGNNITTRLLVLERANFMEIDNNITYDHTDCCKRNGMSKQCMNMCIPRLIETEKFDPIPCQKEFGKLLPCTTDNGNVSHIHCCKLRLVPAFCWDYCSNKAIDFNQANKMCVYWLPEILQCFEHAYLPLPGHPDSLVISQENETALEACWDVPDVRGESVKFYTLHYQEVPVIPLFGGGFPMSPIPTAGRFGAPTLSAPPQESAGDESAVERKKRQSVFITMRNLETNQTDRREYRFQKVNTNDTCLIVADLQPSTQYAFYVTATNDYGESLPSLKELAQTAEANYDNESMPDVLSCCRRDGVSAQCADRMCDMTKPPSSANAFELAFTCRKEFPKVSPCLADKRDHTECCREKGVFGDCLKFCNGSAENLGMASILCLTFDIQSIFGCFRRGYMMLPSHPTNLTVKNILPTSATIVWDEPKTNPKLVSNYSLFYGKDSMTEVTNAVSPYELAGLKPDTVYNVYVIAKAEKGSSLQSAIAAFRTIEPVAGVCQSGKPLVDPSGNPINCASGGLCPSNYKCVAVRSSVANTKYCCPLSDVGPLGPSSRIQEPDVNQCCLKKNVSRQCAKLCNYNTAQNDIIMADVSCSQFIGDFAECGGEGRNNTNCCQESGVPTLCLEFCSPPLTRSITDYVDCLAHTEKIVTCLHEGVLYRPGRPLDVSVEDQGPDWFTLHWKKPDQTVTVQKYEVKINNYTMANTTGLSLTFSGLRMNKQYRIQIVAWNERGSSLPSNLAIVNLSGDTKSPSDDYKPRVPYSIAKVWYRDGSANVTWSLRNISVNGNKMDRVKFLVSYIDDPGAYEMKGTWKNVTTNDMFVILDNLIADKKYDIKVKAINVDKNIEGLYSEVTVLKAVDVDQTALIEMWTDPSGYIKSGDIVEVHCIAKGSIANRMMIMRKGNQNLISGVGNLTLTLRNIKPESGLEPLTCTVNIDGQLVQATQNLKIRYAPIMATAGDSKEMKSLQDAQLEMMCVFRGFPTPEMDWLKFDQQQSSKTIKRTEKLKNDFNHQIESKYDDFKRNAFVNTLTIFRVQMSDAGPYMCKACNEMGCVNRTINLIVEEVNSPSGPEEIMSCCKQTNIRDQCKAACGAESFLSFGQIGDGSCVDQFYKMFRCYPVVIDARKCCQSFAVKSVCESYCYLNPMITSQAKDLSENQTCKVHEPAVAHCLEQAYFEMYPDVTEIKHIESTGDGKVNVTWTVDILRSKNTQEKLIHIVYYKETSEENYHKITTREKYVIVPVKSATDYQFTMLTKNSKGFGMFAPIVAHSAAYYSESVSSGSMGNGTVFLIIAALLILAALVLSAVYFTRRPQQMPTALLKVFKRNHPAANGAVAFENPGYDVDGEGHVHGLPGDPIVPATNLSGAKTTRKGVASGAAVGSFPNAMYESATLESPSSHADNGPMGEERAATTNESATSKYNQLLS